MSSKVHLHIHSAYSDGSDTLESLLKVFDIQGITTFAISDHDTIDGAVLMDVLVNREYYKAIEFSAATSLRECHILGYDYDPHNPSLLHVIEKGNIRRLNNLKKRLEYLKQTYGIEFSDKEIHDLESNPSVGKPHLARCLMNHGYVNGVEEAFKRYLNGMPKSDRVGAQEAIEAIHDAGGIAVWAHPLGGENKAHILDERFDAQLDLLRSYGIDGLECYYSRFTLEEIQFLLDKAKTYDLLVSGGSDYHGMNKTIEIGTLNVEDLPIEDRQLSLLTYIRKRRDNHE